MKRALSLLCLLVAGSLSSAQPTETPNVLSPSRGAPSIQSAEDALVLYAKLTGRTVLRAGSLPKAQISVGADLPADPNAAISFIERNLATVGLEIVRDGEVFAQVLPLGWTNTPLAAQLSAIGAAPPHQTNALNTFNFPSADLNTFLYDFYAPFTGRMLLRSSALPAVMIHLQCQRPLTREETIHAFKTVLALNGVAAIDDGKKFVQIVPLSQATKIQAHAPKLDPREALIDPCKIPVFKFAVAPRTPSKVRNFYVTIYTRLTGHRPPPPPMPTVDRLMAYYAKLAGKKTLPSPQYGKSIILFEATTPLTKPELLYAIETTLAVNGLAIQEIDNHVVRVVHANELGETPPQ